jgi:predicted N-acetyltransferase YhbS
MNQDQTGFGAFDGERIIGFATVSHDIFGKTANYVELVCFQVSEDYRHQGIGKKLFTMICEEAMRLGADKLYISGHSSKESQAAYQALGCRHADEINKILAEKEPFDVQLEYIL